MKAEMARYFERLTQAWESNLGSLPRAPWDEQAEPGIYVGQPDESGYVSWRPLEKSRVNSLSEIERELGVSLGADIHKYFNSYWFCSMGGRIGKYRVSLLPVVPGIELNEFAELLREYVLQRDSWNGFIPIGSEHNGLVVVVDSRTGNVGVEDWERGQVEVLSPGLAELIDTLVV